MSPPRRHRPLWTDTDLRVLLAWTGSDEELATELGRTVRAIRAKRERLRALAPDEATKARARERTNRRALIYQRTHRPAINAAARARAAAERAAATASGPYTADEDELVMRVNLPASHVAVLLGRTTSSVRQRRNKLRNRSR